MYLYIVHTISTNKHTYYDVEKQEKCERHAHLAMNIPAGWELGTNRADTEQAQPRLHV